ncbi:type I-PGING CRISPR-associated protein Cas5p [Dysgonamonadaceae bacterium]|nr:type I-PGING CRISPR-associated protein Cas5p [Dysgonamonadaceae bacterium]
MENLDLSILTKLPDLNSKVILEIEPLAPLSMVSELPGSYYKTLKSPDKKMLCGLFENILGWHIDLADRKLILKDLEKLRRKQIPELKFIDHTKGSTYCPLLMDYFEIELPFIPPKLSNYDDLWSRAFRRADSYRHTFGARYMDTNFIEKWNQIKNRVTLDTKRKSTDKNSLLDKLFKRYIGKFPMYYSTPTNREYIQYGGTFQIKISMDDVLLWKLTKKLEKENLGYLGNNEGWVNVTINKFEL